MRWCHSLWLRFVRCNLRITLHAQHGVLLTDTTDSLSLLIINYFLIVINILWTDNNYNSDICYSLLSKIKQMMNEMYQWTLSLHIRDKTSYTVEKSWWVVNLKWVMRSDQKWICSVLRKIIALWMVTIIHTGNPPPGPSANSDMTVILLQQKSWQAWHQLLSNNTKLVRGSQPKEADGLSVCVHAAFPYYACSL